MNTFEACNTDARLSGNGMAPAIDCSAGEPRLPDPLETSVLIHGYLQPQQQIQFVLLVAHEGLCLSKKLLKDLGQSQCTEMGFLQDLWGKRV